MRGERYHFTGNGMPFNVEGRRGFRRWRFLPDSIVVPDPERLPLLRDHDNSQRLGDGVFAYSTETACIVGGRTNEFVRVGMGLSAGLDNMEYEVVEGVYVVHRADLVEVSIVDNPAFPECVITRVRVVDPPPPPEEG